MMGWTLPATYTAGQRITRADWELIIENVIAIYLGEAGVQDSIGPLDWAQFQDQSGNVPLTVGMMQRNGSALEFSDGVGRAVLSADHATFSSLRTLGTGALQGAPGNHAHSFAATVSAVQGLGVSQSGDRAMGRFDNTSENSSGVRAVTLTKPAMVYVMAWATIGTSALGTASANGTLRIKVGGTTVASGSGTSWIANIYSTNGTPAGITRFLEYTTEALGAGPTNVEATHQGSGDSSKSTLVELRTAVVGLA